MATKADTQCLYCGASIGMEEHQPSCPNDEDDNNA